MTILTRAQIGKVEGIDTTVKSAQGSWKSFAPRWNMVMGLKNGTMRAEEYTKQYTQILDQVPLRTWDKLAEFKKGTLLCYCRDTWFCHTHLIIEYAVKHWPNRFQDGRHDRPQ